MNVSQPAFHHRAHKADAQSAKEPPTTGVLVNCVMPAAAKTDPFDQMKREHIDYVPLKIPMNRFAGVEEVGRW